MLRERFARSEPKMLRSLQQDGALSPAGESKGSRTVMDYNKASERRCCCGVCGGLSAL